MRVWTTDDILKMSSVIVHCKVQGKSTQETSPDAAFQRKRQTSMLTEVRRDYPDLADADAMRLYYEARSARLANDIPTLLMRCQELASKHWGYWPNTLWLAYALRVYGKETYPQAEAVYKAAKVQMRQQLAGKLPFDVVPTNEAVTEAHIREILSMLLKNHAEFYRVQGKLREALDSLNESIELTSNKEALARRYLARAGVLVQQGEMAEARRNIEIAKETHPEEWEQQLEHFTRHYPGFAQALKEVQ